jgi:virginiamycin B lyase
MVMSSRNRIVSLVLILVAFALMCSSAAAATPGEVVPAPVPSGYQPWTLTAAPDGSLAALPFSAGQLLRLAPGGAASSLLPLSAPLGYIQDSVTDAAGNVWVVDDEGVARIAPDGVVTVMTPRLYTENLEADPSIAIGPEGAIWFTAPAEKTIDRLTAAGELTKFTLPNPQAEAAGITAGPDGNLWFTGRIGIREIHGLMSPGKGIVGRITPSGQVSEFATPTPVAGTGQIISGPEGALWFTEPWGSKVGRVTTAGEITEFPVPGPRPRTIVAGPEGDLWVNGSLTGITRVTTWGQATAFPIENGSGDLALGGDGDIWFVGGPTGIGEIAPGAPGLQLRATTARARHGKVTVKLACGGSPTPCRTKVTLGSLAAAVTTTIPAESFGSVTLGLHPKAEAKLAREHKLKAQLSATVAGGPTLKQPLLLRG